MRRLVIEAYEKAKELMTRYQSTLVALADALLDKETLDAPAVDRIMAQAVKDELGIILDPPKEEEEGESPPDDSGV